MAIVTSLAHSIPDLNHEYYTITIDSVGQASANTFVCHLQQPLKNVVQARLLATRITTTTATNHCYVSINELDSIFSDRASNVLTEQASLSLLRNSFASLVTTDDTGVISFRDQYPIVTQYINPIRRLDRFTVNIRDQDGNLITPPSPAENNFLVIRFVCKKGNL